MSSYGREITTSLAAALARAGVVVVSGLAYGVDTCAHRATLSSAGRTIAVLPSSVGKIYPSGHTHLAEQIVQQGGALVSEYPPGTIPYPVNFIARNRIVAGLSNVVLVTEASAKSGTLHTTRFALEQGVDVWAVPGNITSPLSYGTNELLKSGAGAVTTPDDLFAALGIVPSSRLAIPPSSNNPAEQAIITLLAAGITQDTELLSKSNLTTQAFNQTLTMLEISGTIRSIGNNRWQLC